VRGDSLRDLYAKGWALLGLGVLAGVGAAVDYWPTGGQVPSVAGALVRPDVLAVPAPPDERSVRVASVGSPRRAPAPVAPAGRIAAPRPALGAAAQAVPVTAGDQVVSLGAPPPASMAADGSIDDEAVPLEASAAFAEEASPDAIRVLASAATESTRDDGRGILTSATAAAKKAGTSLVNTSGKAGASIVDGLTFVSRSLRRLKFF
jgi:hypothetical protein